MSDTEPLDLIWGVRDIARFIGRTERQCYEALSKGELPGKRVNHRWVASKKALREFFEVAA